MPVASPTELLQKLGETTIPADLVSRRSGPEGTPPPQLPGGHEDVTRKEDDNSGLGIVSAFWESLGAQ